ncbi:MAG TPA: hypothetical protein VGD17_16785 [Chitinophagaceae bacterium]
MRTPILLLLLASPIILTAQDLIFAPGSTKVLTAEDRILSLKKFTLGDNVTIIIPPTMNGWTVTATDVTIGNNVKIIGQSNYGYGGASGSSAGAAPNCMKGSNGMNGANGAAGMIGKSISLNLKIRNIGSLTINIPGGNGGFGGYGGNGGRGGNASCVCNAGQGGNGGKGGNGGNGGNGGSVSIVYSKIGNISISNSNFIIQNPGGVGGNGGAGGAGGPGGAGGGCPDSKSLVRPAGAPGLGGASGTKGLTGQNGTSTISAR